MAKIKKKKVDVAKLRMNPEKNIRRRATLQEHYKHGNKLLFVGLLRYVHGQSSTFNKNSWVNQGLIVDIHEVYNKPSGLTLGKIELNHTHFKSNDNNMLLKENELILFTAKITKYNAKYLGNNETRYGLTDIRLFEDKFNEINKIGSELSVAYANKLTIHQKESLSTVRHFMVERNRLSKQTLKALRETSRTRSFGLGDLNRQINGILNMSEMSDFKVRTLTLSKLSDLFSSGHTFSLDPNGLKFKVVVAGSDNCLLDINVKSLSRKETNVKVQALELQNRLLKEEVKLQKQQLSATFNRIDAVRSENNKLIAQNRNLVSENQSLMKQGVITRLKIKLMRLFNFNRVKPEQVVPSRTQARTNGFFDESSKMQEVDNDLRKSIKKETIDKSNIQEYKQKADEVLVSDEDLIALKKKFENF